MARQQLRPSRLAAGARGGRPATARVPHAAIVFYVSHVRAQDLPLPLSEQLTGHVDERTHRGYTRPILGTKSQIREPARAFDPKDAR